MCWIVLCIASCTVLQIPDPSIQNLGPTPPTTLPELIAVLSDGSGPARVGAALVLGDMGPKAAPAVPALIKNLDYDHSDVQISAAEALGKIGPAAKPAVPTLIRMLQNADYVNTRKAAATALGWIGDPSSVPALVNVLYEEAILGPTPTPVSCEPIGWTGAKVCTYGEEANKWRRTNEGLTLDAAEAIARITGENFPDMDSHGRYRSNEGIPLTIVAAKEWWEKEGQFKQWPPVVTSTPEPMPTPGASP